LISTHLALGLKALVVLPTNEQLHNKTQILWFIYRKEY